jgi:hypothetical protein
MSAGWRGWVQRLERSKRVYNAADFGKVTQASCYAESVPVFWELKIKGSNGIPASVLLIRPINNLDLTVCAPLSSISVSACDGLSVHKKRSNENEAD